jgi:DNA-binding MarR family transcriptional regulator
MPGPQRADLEMHDTPALDILRRRPDDFGGVAAADLKVAQDLLRVSKRMLGSFADEFARHGLSPGRYALLMALYKEERPLAPSEIATRIGVARATVTGLIDGMSRDGLVAHVTPAEGDRRRKSIGLSAKGRRVLLKLLPDVFAQMTALVAPLTKSERAQLQSALLKIEAGLHKAAGAPR